MSRHAEDRAEFFPHHVGGGKTLRALENRYGNDGYALWFKLLETVCGTETHCFDLSDELNLIDFAGYVRQSEEWVIEAIDFLVRLKQIDRDLWEADRKVWIQGLVDNLEPLYTKRKRDKPTKPIASLYNCDSVPEKPAAVHFCSRNDGYDAFQGDSVPEMPQRREEYRRVEESREDQARRAREDMPTGDEPPEPASLAYHQVAKEAADYGLPVEVNREDPNARFCAAEYPLEWCREAFAKTASKISAGENISNPWAYAKRILRGYKASGGPDISAPSTGPPADSTGYFFEYDGGRLEELGEARFREDLAHYQRRTDKTVEEIAPNRYRVLTKRGDAACGTAMPVPRSPC